MLKIAGITSIWLGTTLTLLPGCGSLPTSATGNATSASSGTLANATAKGTEKPGPAVAKDVESTQASHESKAVKSLAGESCPTLEVVSRILQKDLNKTDKAPHPESAPVPDSPGKPDPQIQTVSFQVGSAKSPLETSARDKAFPLSTLPVATKPPVAQKAKVIPSEGDAKPPEPPTPGILPSSLEQARDPGANAGAQPKTQPAGQDQFQFTKLVLCKKVEGFGQYEPIKPGYKFNPGSKGQPGERVLLYAEMNNPPGRLVDGLHRTNLCGEVEILRQNDQALVCKLGFPGREDCSRTPRKDHHLVYSFHVPAGLPPGTYSLRVNARESSPVSKEASGKSSETKQGPCAKASASVDFQVDVGRTGNESSLESKPRAPVGGMTP